MKTSTESVSSLKSRWEEYKKEQPQSRIRNAARDLGVSEMELLATGIGENVIRLEGDWTAFLKEVKSLGYVMALTRNDSVVHERKGVYNNVSFNNHVGLVLDPAIDLRLFMQAWKFGFAVKEPFRGDFRYSFQFFDKYGEAVHKIYMTDKSDLNAYHNLTGTFKSAEQNNELPVEQKSNEPAREMPDSMIDKAALGEDWKALKDTHDFYMLLGKYRVSRTQILRLAPEDLAVKLTPAVLRPLMDGAAEKQIPIMVFVGNKGCIQIHTGEIKNVAAHENWYNVLDPEFNLHVNENDIDQAWLVRKPTQDGIVTAVEFYDSKGELIVQFFGKRKPGIPEDENWRNFADALVSVN